MWYRVPVSRRCLLFTFKINGANHDVTLAEEDLDGMKEIKEKLARSRGGRQKWKQGASLSEEDFGRPTAKNESEELLDMRIKEHEEAISTAVLGSEVVGNGRPPHLGSPM